MNQCRCGKCNGYCGPNNGCPCDSCRALLRKNREGAVVRIGGDDPNRSLYGGDTGLPASQVVTWIRANTQVLNRACFQVYYCGRKKNQCRCGRCDGNCGPSNGCPCNACRALLYTNDEGAVVHLGNNSDYGAYVGDTGLMNNQARMTLLICCDGITNLRCVNICRSIIVAGT
jgi:hypothetical protein